MFTWKAQKQKTNSQNMQTFITRMWKILRNLFHFYLFTFALVTFFPNENSNLRAIFPSRCQDLLIRRWLGYAERNKIDAEVENQRNNILRFRRQKLKKLCKISDSRKQKPRGKENSDKLNNVEKA